MIAFIFPHNGDFVNSRDGEWTKEGLVITVHVKSDRTPTINGVTATRCEDGSFSAKIALCGYRNCIVLKTENEEKRISVYVSQEKYVKKFRISSDDNIRFLKELTEGDYKSIFDHPYLAVYKKAHDLYGAKVHINLFYCFGDKSRTRFSDGHEYFDLSMMTDRYKDEFIANSDWLKLAFHAKDEYPEKPYKFADREKIHNDCVAVCREICRFAGKECISNSTTLHWGEGNREVIRELRALGFTSLTGYFKRNDNGEPSVSYYVDGDDLDRLDKRDFWKDIDEDMIFGRIDRVLNIGTLESVISDVEKIINDAHRGGFVSLMIHEQYFYDDYVNYRADFEQRVLIPCKMLAENDYTGAHITEVTSERALNDYPEF